MSYFLFFCNSVIVIRLKLVAKENHFTLELQNCMAEDSGQYSCRVTGGDKGTITCSAHLEVHECKFSNIDIERVRK